QVAGEEGRDLIAAVLHDAGKERRHAASFELLGGVVFLPRLGADHEPLPLATERLRKRLAHTHMGPCWAAISMPWRSPFAARCYFFFGGFCRRGGSRTPPSAAPLQRWCRPAYAPRRRGRWASDLRLSLQSYRIVHAHPIRRERVACSHAG